MGGSRAERQIGVLKFRREYWSWILSQKISSSDYIADFQEYVEDRHPIYDFPISGREGDEELLVEPEDTPLIESDIDDDIRETEY